MLSNVYVNTWRTQCVVSPKMFLGNDFQKRGHDPIKSKIKIFVVIVCGESWLWY